MKLFITAALLSICAYTAGAQTYITRAGKISFNATAPSSPEKIEAVNNEAACIVDAKTGDVRFQVLIKSFKFERALMQEHFNENYMQSDTYPKAEFKGNIGNMPSVDINKDGAYAIKVAGRLTMHGVTNDVAVPGTLTVKGKTIMLNAKFAVTLADYKVDVPKLVADKVSKQATLTINAGLALK